MSLSATFIVGFSASAISIAFLRSRSIFPTDAALFPCACEMFGVASETRAETISVMHFLFIVSIIIFGLTEKTLCKGRVFSSHIGHVIILLILFNRCRLLKSVKMTIFAHYAV